MGKDFFTRLKPSRLARLGLNLRGLPNSLWRRGYARLRALYICLVLQLSLLLQLLRLLLLQ